MKITCQACEAKYTIADEKVSGRTVKIKCKKCGATIMVSGNDGQGAPMSSSIPGAAPHEEGDDLGATRVYAGDSNTASGPSPVSMEWTVSVADGDERQLTTAQIGQEIQRGVVNADTYVWRDGMSDWLPVSQVPELASMLSGAAPVAPAYAPPAYAAPAAVVAAPAAAAHNEPDFGLGGTMVMTDQVSPFASNAPRPAAGVAAPAPIAAAPVVAPVAAAQPATSQPAARRAGRAAGGVDVFDAAEKREGPAPPRPPDRRVGERNENSVLFSLSALTATETAAAKTKEESADLGLGGNGKSPFDDLMSIGGGGIGGAPALAPPPLLAPVVEAPPPPAPIPMAAPAYTAPGAAAAFAMPMEPPKKSKTGLIVGVLIAVLAAGGAAAFLMIGGGGGAGPSASTSSSVSAAPSTTTSNAATASTTSEAPSSAPTATDAPASSGSGAVVAVGDPKSTGASGGPGTTPSTKPSSSASTAPTTSTTEKPPETSASATATGEGGREFNKGAATTALASAAGAARGCKTADGPTGSGRVRVTFAPSGNVTSAQVQGPPFAGTPVGGCVAAAFRGAHVPPFDGSPVSVTKSFNIN